jgi:hypothetical protein
MNAYSGPKNLVIPSLILYLDAANPNSYPRSGNTWTDLCNTRNSGTLTNGPTYSANYGGSIVLDGTNDYIAVPDSTALGITGDKTVSCWVFLKSNDNGNGYALAGKMSAVTRGLSLSYGNAGNGFISGAWDASYTPFIAKDLSRDINKWVYATAVLSGTTRLIYVWDVLGLRSASTAGTDQNSWNNSLEFTLGATGDSFDRRYSNAIFSCATVYNRALSSSEIQQNFNALRARFGI